MENEQVETMKALQPPDGVKPAETTKNVWGHASKPALWAH